MQIDEQKKQSITPFKHKIVSQNEDEIYEVDIWHEFSPKKTYLASADISEGIGGDSSVLYIWDVSDLQNIIMCARFSSNVTSLVQFAYVASKLLPLYGSPWLAAERNGVSAGMLDSLRITFGYSKIVIDNKKHEPGIYSHVQVKSRACLWMREMMTSQCFGFTIYDKALVDELGIFIKKDTKGSQNVYHAMPGPSSHDDHVMAFIWATWILSNDKINDFFIVVDTTTTEYGVVHARHLKPLEEYSSEEVQAALEDPLYKEFKEFSAEAMKKNEAALKKIEAEDYYDNFKYQKPDEYFGDMDDGESWTTSMSSRKKPEVF